MYQQPQAGTPANSLRGGASNGYAPPYPMQTPTFVWVNGLEMAINWPVSAGSSLIMMDSQNPALYIKSVDSTGRALPIEIYDLVRREPNPGDAYVTKAEVEALFEQYLGNRNRQNNKYYNKSKKQESEAEE